MLGAKFKAYDVRRALSGTSRQQDPKQTSTLPWKFRPWAPSLHQPTFKETGAILSGISLELIMGHQFSGLQLILLTDLGIYCGRLTKVTEQDNRVNSKKPPVLKVNQEEIDAPPSEARRANMRAIKSSGTSAEKRVRRFLHAHGFRFRLGVRSLPGTPDIVLKKYGTIVFVHGCFWHQQSYAQKLVTAVIRRRLEVA